MRAKSQLPAIRVASEKVEVVFGHIRLRWQLVLS